MSLSVMSPVGSGSPFTSSDKGPGVIGWVVTVVTDSVVKPDVSVVDASVVVYSVVELSSAVVPGKPSQTSVKTSK